MGERRHVDRGRGIVVVPGAGHAEVARRRRATRIIQSLIRNTKSGKGKPVIDPERKRGFGEVDLNALLTVDPTQYKDVNPIWNTR